MRAAREFPAGFDYLRVILAVSVVILHTRFVCLGHQGELKIWGGWLRPYSYSILPAFFGLAGFLVTASLQRNTLPGFLGLRAARIFPALFCEILISALLIGPQISTLSYREYFDDSTFWTYLLNMVGYIHYKLPGVFVNNPGSNEVNTQLWTIPYEFGCYVMMAVLARISGRRRPWLVLGVALFLTAISVPKDMHDLMLISRPPGRLLVLSCLWGMLLYLWRDKVPHSPLAFSAALGACILAFSFKALTCLGALPATYLAIWVGTHNPPRHFPVSGTDYSYGIYVYGFPIQQTLVALVPIFGIWYVNAVASVIVSWIAAFLSWNLVEGPVMARKRQIVSSANALWQMLVTPAVLAHAHTFSGTGKTVSPASDSERK